MAFVLRCTGCTAEYAPHEVPQTCTRCGSSASWCQINLPDEFSEQTDALLAEVRGDGDAEGDPQQRAREKMLGVEKPRGLCSQVDCVDAATHRFTWPGNPERSVCPKHAAAASRVAQAMGFFLEVPALDLHAVNVVEGGPDAGPPTPRDMPPQLPHG
jgi:hypothetical protein